MSQRGLSASLCKLSKAAAPEAGTARHGQAAEVCKRGLLSPFPTSRQGAGHGRQPMSTWQDSCRSQASGSFHQKGRQAGVQ